MTEPYPSTDAAALFGVSRRAAEGRPAISVVLPMFDEEGAADALIAEIEAALSGTPHEIIAVDDCSRDRTRAVLTELKTRRRTLRVILHGANAGQSRAVRSGVVAACAPVIATMDGDGQNDPADLPALLAALTRKDAPARLAMVAGERQARRDVATKKAASRAANWLRRRILADGSADSGCGLKVFYRDAYLRLPYFDPNHRFLPALMLGEGFAVEHLAVSHRPRLHGASKYTNWGRLTVAIRDLLGVVWLKARARDPETISEVEPGPGCVRID